MLLLIFDVVEALTFTGKYLRDFHASFQEISLSLEHPSTQMFTTMRMTMRREITDMIFDRVSLSNALGIFNLRLFSIKYFQK